MSEVEILKAKNLELIAEIERITGENQRLRAGVESDLAEIDRIQGVYDAHFRKTRSYRMQRDQAKDESDQLKAENTDLHATLQAAKGEIERLKGESEALRATSDLKALLPDIDDALEDLELHGRHSDQGYRKLKDWYRKVALAYRVIDGPMFGAEHGELVSQNIWLRSVVEHYAQQHAPLEPIPDRDGWSTRLPGYDLPALLKDAQRYRYMRKCSCDFRSSLPNHEPVSEADYDAECDAGMSKEASHD